MTQLYWGSTEVAEALGIRSRTTALKIMTRSGLATSFGIPNGSLHVPIEPFMRWLTSQRVEPAEKQAPTPKPRKRPRIDGLTADGLIPYRKTKKGA